MSKDEWPDERIEDTKRHVMSKCRLAGVLDNQAIALIDQFKIYHKRIRAAEAEWLKFTHPEDS